MSHQLGTRHLLCNRAVGTNEQNSSRDCHQAPILHGSNTPWYCQDIQFLQTAIESEELLVDSQYPSGNPQSISAVLNIVIPWRESSDRDSKVMQFDHVELPHGKCQQIC